jgi:nucleoside-diphosphate-sugar epimerase
MKSTKTIGILGCGWLGKPLAVQLIQNGHMVKGSVRSKEKIQELDNLGVISYLIEIGKDSKEGKLKAFLNGLDVLIISIPPKFKKGEEDLYVGLQSLFKFYDFSKIEKLIYISSTGVFEDGVNNLYTEESRPNNTTERGQYLIKLEELIFAESCISDKSILRLGGLIQHEGRHPIYYLAGKKNVLHPDAPVNLIEQADAVNLLCNAIALEESMPSVMHGVNPEHPSRRHYYTQKALGLGLQPPEFNEEGTSLGKSISSEMTSKALNFKYKRGI